MQGDNWIRFVDRDDQLVWFIDETWFDVKVEVKGTHREIMNWLEQEAEGEVVIYAGGRIPTKGTHDFTDIMYGNRRHYTFFFESMETAMLFKLTWYHA